MVVFWPPFSAISNNEYGVNVHSTVMSVIFKVSRMLKLTAHRYYKDNDRQNSSFNQGINF